MLILEGNMTAYTTHFIFKKYLTQMELGIR